MLISVGGVCVSPHVKLSVSTVDKDLRRWNLIASQEHPTACHFFSVDTCQHFLFDLEIFTLFFSPFFLMPCVPFGHFALVYGLPAFWLVLSLWKFCLFPSNWNTRKSNLIHGHTYPEDCFIADTVSSCLVAGGLSYEPWQSFSLAGQLRLAELIFMRFPWHTDLIMRIFRIALAVPQASNYGKHGMTEPLWTVFQQGLKSVSLSQSRTGSRVLRLMGSRKSWGFETSQVSHILWMMFENTRMWENV